MSAAPVVRAEERSSQLKPNMCGAGHSPAAIASSGAAGSMSVADRIAMTTVESSLGLMPTEVGRGRAVLRMPLEPGATASHGRVHPTVLSVAADAAAGVAVFLSASRPGGVTAELRLDEVGPVAANATHLAASGFCLGLDGDLGFARVEIKDDRGGLVAHAVGVMVLDPVGVSPDSAGRDSARQVTFELADVRVEGAAGDVARAVVTPGMANRRGAVHGGVLMGLAHEAHDQFHRERGVRFRRLGLGVEYLRPAPAGTDLTFHSEFVRGGRRLWTVRTEVCGGDGRTLAIATGTSAILP